MMQSWYEIVGKFPSYANVIWCFIYLFGMLALATCSLEIASLDK